MSNAAQDRETDETAPEDAQPTQPRESGKGAVPPDSTVAEARDLLQRRFAAMADPAADLIERALRSGLERRGGDRLRIAQFVVETVLDRAPAPDVTKPSAGQLRGLPSDPKQRSELAEKLRLQKQAERRR